MENVYVIYDGRTHVIWGIFAALKEALEHTRSKDFSDFFVIKKVPFNVVHELDFDLSDELTETDNLKSK